MVGVVPTGPATPTRTTGLDPGDLLVLYTDGLIERRDQDLDAGFAALIRAADDLAGRPAETVCAALTDRMLPDQEHEDDVCLLVLRLVPGEDRRP